MVSKKLGILNHVSFNPEEPIIIVGDSRGYVHSLKLSPNLRKKSQEALKALQEQETVEWRKTEVRKLQQLLTQLIEPHVVTKEEATRE